MDTVVSMESSELPVSYLLMTESVLVHERPGTALDQGQRDRWGTWRPLLSEGEASS